MNRAQCTLAVQGLDCPSEAAALREALAGEPGVLDLDFNLLQGTLTVGYNQDIIDENKLIKMISERTGMVAAAAGVPSGPPVGPGRLLGSGPWAVTALAGLALLSAVLLEMLAGAPTAARVGYLVAVLAGGAWLLPKAIAALRKFRLDMHVLMTIAVAGAVALGSWDEAATVAFLFGLSEALEALSLDRARRAVRRLLDLAPDTAERIEPDGSVRVLPARAIQPGDRVRVRAGMRIPVDGRVVAGRSSIDQKAITGESVPVPCAVGSSVYAGTVNGDGALDIEATKPLDDAVVSRIAEQVRAAQAGRAPVERTIERFAAIYTPLVVVLAVLVMVVPPLLLGGGPAWSLWAFRGLVVLVTACPCALVIATPVAVVSALTAAARRGVLVKGGAFLETVGTLNVLAFDKTGTLTLGEPAVVEVVPAAGQAGDDLLRIAAALGDRGGHLLGRAIARHARTLDLSVPQADDYEAVPGLGARGRVAETDYHIGSHRFLDESGKCAGDFHDSLGAAEADIGTAVAVSGASGPVGWIRLADRPRPEAQRVLAELHALGLKTVMLTGDNPATAAAMARELGIDDFRALLLPADKARAVAELEAELGPTGMVGDGVNDAPALAAARVSVALGGIASAAAVEAADIVLMADDLTALPWLIRHSRRTLARIRQNILLAVGSKLAVLVLAILGWASLWLAIAADLGVSLIVVANALRLLRSAATPAHSASAMRPNGRDR